MNENSNKIYLELHNTYLLLIVMTKQKVEFIINSETTQIIPLNNLEFDDGIVNNPTTISRFIKNYVESQNLKNPEAVICLRNAENISDARQKFMTLQLALLIAKAGLIISEIVHGPVMPWNNTNMLNGKILKKDLSKKKNLFKLLTPPSYTNPQSWMIISTFSLILCISFVVSNYIGKRKEIAILQVTLDTLQEQTNVLEKKTHQIKELKASHEEVKNEHIFSYSTLLKLFSRNIPQNSWLKRLKKEEHGEITIVGNTLKNEDISVFLNNLSQDKLIKNPTLVSLEMVKNSSPTLYSFTIQGQIPS